MPAAGPNWTGTGANSNDGGTTAWSNPTNIQGDTTSTAATCAVSSNGGTSQLLRASNFGFSIDAAAVITGVLVEVERNSANNNRQYENQMKLLVSGGEAGNNKSAGAAIQTTKGFANYGADGDNWGNSLTPSIVNASDFGFSHKISRNSSSATTTSVYRIRITVYYSLGSIVNRESRLRGVMRGVIRGA